MQCTISAEITVLQGFGVAYRILKLFNTLLSQKIFGSLRAILTQLSFLEQGLHNDYVAFSS